jgi:UDP-3-O-[3-hydroxymyristoyl] glucosamine N-acyltransferase
MVDVCVGVGVMVVVGVGRSVRLGVGVGVPLRIGVSVTLGSCVEIAALEVLDFGDSKDGYAKIRKITAKINMTSMSRLVSKN